ncbi:MAG TPA: dienelactone hydrolase family protein [Gammaproteobacteria bacterium]|nr:dienelactone hydrolase family protein [Gammaproteobacteria bacterium]
MQKSQLIHYRDGATTCHGHLVFPEQVSAETPIVLVAHDWSGRNAFADEKAAELAQLGYIGFAMDLYGEGRVGSNNDEKLALMSPLASDRNKLKQRLLAAVETAKNLGQGNPKAIAAIGFCFGGLSVLDLARTGEPLAGVVSFHGLLNAPEGLTPNPIQAKVLALHGYNDPMAKPPQVMAFADEMTKAGADWQVTMYGNTVHAFMNPLAHDEALGLVYSPHIAKRAFSAMSLFLKEIFKR